MKWVCSNYYQGMIIGNRCYIFQQQQQSFWFLPAVPICDLCETTINFVILLSTVSCVWLSSTWRRITFIVLWWRFRRRQDVLSIPSTAWRVSNLRYTMVTGMLYYKPYKISNYPIINSLIYTNRSDLLAYLLLRPYTHFSSTCGFILFNCRTSMWNEGRHRFKVKVALA